MKFPPDRFTMFSQFRFRMYCLILLENIMKQLVNYVFNENIWEIYDENIFFTQYIIVCNMFRKYIYDLILFVKDYAL